MPDTKTQRRAKQGVHGWRAFFLMFGCGTTAALLVVGIVVGGLRIFVSSVSSASSGQADGGDQPIPTWQAPSSLDVGVLDLCGKTMESISGINVPRRLDDDDDYLDTGEGDPEGKGRVIRDECDWEFIPMASGVDSWNLTLEYESFITESEGGGVLALAADAYGQEKLEVSDWFGEIDDTGSEDITGDSQYFYRGSRGGDGGQYAIVGKVKGSVYVIRIEDGGESTSKELFWNELEPVVDRIAINLERWTPS